MFSKFYQLIIFAFLVLLGGCVGQTAPEITSYTITISGSHDVTASKQPVFSKVLKVSIPKSSSAIMSRDILYQGKNYSLNAYAYSRWSDTPNRMLGNLFISSLRKGNVFRVVLPVTSRGKGDYVLESTLYEFQQHINANNTSEVRIRVMFYLINKKNGDVVASKELSASEPARSVDVKGGVSALNKASNIVATRLNEWLLSLDIQ